MKEKKGYTLVELIIALVLIAVIAVTGFEFLHYCQRFILNTKKQLMAYNFARETMEELYFEADTPITATPVDSPLPDSELKDNHAGTRSYTVQNNSTNDYEIITTTVTWN